MILNIPKLEDLNFIQTISDGDWMMRADREPDWYFRRGYGAMAMIAHECQRARLYPASILDFGCGHGCVARMLKALYPKAKLTGQEVNPDWLAWCSDILGIETILSPPSIEEVVLDENSYDIIWAGSIFSHIPETAARHLLGQFRRGLTDRGIAIFSTAGQIMRNAYVPGGMHNVSDEQIAQMSAAFDRNEYAFGAYDRSLYPNWGHSLIPSQWFFARSAEFDMPLTGFYDAGWGATQDIYAMRKSRNPISWR